MDSICAVIPAAGSGSRMGLGINKQFLKLKGKPVIVRTLDAFYQSRIFNKIVVVVKAEEITLFASEILKRYKYKNLIIAKGGPTRQDSVFNGLLKCPDDTDIVVIHDGARPLIDVSTIKGVVQAAKEFKAVTTAVPVKDTIKESCQAGFVVKTLNRSKLWNIQTPQAFEYDLIIKAHQYAKTKGLKATDDSKLVEELGVRVKIEKGSYQNIKITTPEDLIFAEQFLSKRGI